MGSDPKTAFDYYYEQVIESSFTARYSKSDDNQAWSFQAWKISTSMRDRWGQPFVTPQRGARPQQVIIGNNETELELPVE